MKVLNKIDGYKTYVLIVIGAIVIGLKELGYITPELYTILTPLVALLTAGAIRHGISK